MRLGGDYNECGNLKIAPHGELGFVTTGAAMAPPEKGTLRDDISPRSRVKNRRHRIKIWAVFRGVG